jgi:exopolysaccharide biosynthesis polyprenyl glycosylphosphotransferase
MGTSGVAGRGYIGRALPAVAPEQRSAVESAPRDVRVLSSTTPDHPPASRSQVDAAPAPLYIAVPEVPLAAGDTPARVRLGLQQHAAANLRRHVLRAAHRFVVLVVADLGSFYVMRALLRAVRNYAVLGDPLAAAVRAVLPSGMLNGWQYAAALFVGLLVTGNYGPGDCRRDPRRLFLGCALATALPLWMTIWTRGLEPVLVQYALVTLLVWVGLSAERLTVDRIAAWVRPPERDALDTLFVGPGEACVVALESPAFALGTDYRPIGFVDVRIPPAPGALGHISDFSLLLAASGAQVVVVCGYLTDRHFEEIVDTALAGGCQVLSVPRSVEIAGVQPMTVWRRGQPLVQLTAPTLKGWQLAVKRMVDVIGSAIGLAAGSPLMAAIALAIKVDSPGPVLFKQERAGFGGGPFRILKFRTMRDGADAQKKSVAHLNHTGDPRLFKIPDDPRVTQLGRWLRRWSLDELPQLWNVLVGEMSLVGPRPFFEADLAEYRDHHFRRLGAKPGITGLWQVKGRSSVTDFEEVVRLDRDYIERWSFWMDLEIIALTLPAVIRRTGAF